jgi:hypothetical protein
MRFRIDPDDKDMLETLSSLKTLTGTKDYGEAIVRAVELAVWLYGEQAAGRRVAIVDEDANRVRQYVLDRGPRRR